MSTAQPRRGFIRCYGLFWSAYEVNWSPGSGKRLEFQILGRRGTNKPTVQVCDFRYQNGVYVLYDDYGPYYVGLARDRTIGNRLKEHTRDRHRSKWDRFSWFGFRPVLKATCGDGTQALGKVPKRLLADSRSTVADIEALLIQSLGTQVRGNRQEMRFAAADPWTQVMEYEIETYLTKVC